MKTLDHSRVQPTIVDYPTCTCRSNEQSCMHAQENVQVEHTLDIYINDILAMRVVCTPDHLIDLVVGRLFTEGIIVGLEDIDALYLCENSWRARVMLNNRKADFTRTHVETVPSCCTGNRTLNDYFGADTTLSPVTPIPWHTTWIFNLAREFAKDTPMHSATYGSHSCFLSVKENLLCCREDLGRHNAFDKVIGYALRNEIDLTQAIVFTSGRLPVDMVTKAIHARIPILVSKAVPTDLTVEIAREFDLTLICSAHPDSMKIYHDPQAKEFAKYSPVREDNRTSSTRWLTRPDTTYTE